MDLQESHAENYLEEPGHNGAGWERGGRRQEGGTGKSRWQVVLPMLRAGK